MSLTNLPVQTPADTILISHKGYDNTRVASFKHEIWTPEDPSLPGVIQNFWDNKQLTNPGDNGALVRLDSAVVSPNRELVIYASLTDYMNHIGTRTQRKKENRADPIYISGLVLTSDGYLVFGRRSDVDRGRGEYNVFAGGVRPTDVTLDSNPSLDVALYREFTNAFLLSADELHARRSLYGFSTMNEQTPSFLSAVQVNYTKKDFEELFAREVATKIKNGGKVKMDALDFLENSPEAFAHRLRRTDVTDRPHVRALYYYNIAHNQQF